MSWHTADYIAFGKANWKWLAPTVVVVVLLVAYWLKK